MQGMKNKKGKVFVGLSGGVDSSVTAVLLQKQGYDVSGVFIKVWQADFLPCTWKEERRSAIRVAAHLNIPFHTLDLSKEYKQEVVDYMVGEYKNGRVPNPDVMCNKKIKFGGFLKWALSQGADFVATGHYVRLLKQTTSDKQQTIKLLKGVDGNKDQSYFLWTLTQEQLKHSIFPIGEYHKQDVRKMAQRFGLATAERKDSQGLCFVGKVDMKDFLKHFIEEKEGDVLDTLGNKIGVHEGAFFYTVGQRHGFTVIKKSTNEKPYYVVDKNVEKNIIIVSHEPKEEHSKKEVEMKNVNWISEVPEVGKKYGAKTRYRQKDINCYFEEGKTFLKSKIIFSALQNIAPGQSLVLYDGDECLGGGIMT